MTRHEQKSFLSGASSAYLEDLYEKYVRDPSSVEPGWRAFFAQLGEPSAAQALSTVRGASWGRPVVTGLEEDLARRPRALATAPDIRTAVLQSIRARLMIRIYRVRGHLLANLDPLGLMPRPLHPDLDPKTYGFTEADYDRTVMIDGAIRGLESMTVRAIIAHLSETYCNRIGYEYVHIQDPEQRAWIETRIEAPEHRQHYSARSKRTLLLQLTNAETFERLLSVKYTGTKQIGRAHV